MNTAVEHPSSPGLGRGNTPLPGLPQGVSTSGAVAGLLPGPRGPAVKVGGIRRHALYRCCPTISANTMLLDLEHPPTPKVAKGPEEASAGSGLALTDLAIGHVRIWVRQPEPSSQKAHKDGRESEMHRKSISASGSH